MKSEGAKALRPLPSPDDPILHTLEGLGASHHQLYGYLHERRNDPPTMSEIRDFDRTLTGATATTARSQIDRRVRDLYVHFVITKTRVQGERAPRYRLDGWETRPRQSKNTRISGALRARILAPQRCAMCGRTPLLHGVVLVVDHKLPQDWGGLNSEDNLQPLCEECNGGKKAWFATYDRFAEQIAQATRHPEPQGRIGELLKAFDGELVPSDLLSVVASMGAFQEDWQRRLRDLRTIGWKIDHKNVYVNKNNRRVQSHYFLVRAQPWPSGSISAAVHEAERRDAARVSG